MSDTTILELTTASVVSETEDYIPMVDVSDTTESNDGTTKRATVRKLLKDKALPSGDIVGTSDEQTLENKTLVSPEVTNVDITGGSVTNVDITGGSVSATTDVVEVLKKVYPVGCIYVSTVSTNPNTLFGFGTWEAFGEGRTLVGKASSGTFDTAGSTGGVETVTLTGAQSGTSVHNHGNTGNNHRGHTHNQATVSYGVESKIDTTYTGYLNSTFPVNSTATSGESQNHYHSVGNSSAANASQAHNNLQPYIVTYFFKRTA